MKIFAVETSCDETSWCLASFEQAEKDYFDLKVITHRVKTQAAHEKYGGIVPELASREHIDYFQQCCEEIFEAAKEADLIAVTCGPGLKGSLLTGVALTRALSIVLGKPLLGVDHVEAHLYSPCIFPHTFPFLSCVFSGGHTLIAQLNNLAEYQVISQTIDDAVGEAFDKCGVLLGLSYPAGPKLAQLADKYEDNDFFDFPIPMKDKLDFSFSGFKTAVKNLIMELGELTSELKIKVAASIQKGLVEALVFKIQQAMDKTKINHLGLSGGVAQNKLLRAKAAELSERTLILPPELCGDNALVIALRAFQLLKVGKAKLYQTAIFDSKKYK
jgi:N6-L-threonylcarbamoyladenine synthase